MKYFAAVRDENCSDLKSEASSKVYRSEVVSTPLHVHAQWTGFSVSVTDICTERALRCEMWTGLQESWKWPRVSCGNLYAEIFKAFLKNTVCCMVSYLNDTF